ncbi:MAG TPA: hypothetical protein VJ953_10050 [Saprospiraceae bacterium]|nr:hypothetical protein [Saprospiraceae bacterium]
MKSFLLSIVFLTSLFSGLNAQDKAVNPLSSKMVLVELEEDFSAFQKKISQLNLKKANKTQLADEYSDLIDRIDAQFHTTQVKNEVQFVASKPGNKKNH